ncbi:MAG: tetratricopeptide repeat protein [Bacteroidota bacterium]
MAKTKTRATQKGSDKLLENPEALAEKLTASEEFLEKNKVAVIGVVAVIVLVVGGFFGYNYYQSNQNDIAQSEMFQAIFYFESDSLDYALNGDGNSYGFREIVDQYSGTDAANLANYYIGAIYLKQGKFELATLYLKDFSSSDLLIQARAYSLIGDAHMEQQQYSEAAEYYDKAANYKPNKFFTPQYLLKEALAHEKLNNLEEAKKCYDEIIEKYWDANEAVQKAKKYKARLNASAS